MLTVELIYDRDCPHVKDAGAQLQRAFTQAGLVPRWQEWDRGDPESPAHVRIYGSPTILVNGRDVADASPSTGASCCRLYPDESGRLRGVPSSEIIASALLGAKEGVSPNSSDRIQRRSGWRSAWAALPAIGTAILPICPACWPAYMGLLSSLGLGFVNYAPYLLPLTTILLILSVTLLGWRAKTRRGYKPLAMGIAAAIMILVGKFVFLSDAVLYGGMALLVVTSLWNAWPKRKARSGSCPACIPAGPLSNNAVVQITLEKK